MKNSEVEVGREYETFTDRRWAVVKVIARDLVYQKSHGRIVFTCFVLRTRKRLFLNGASRLRRKRSPTVSAWFRVVRVWDGGDVSLKRAAAIITHAPGVQSIVQDPTVCGGALWITMDRDAAAFAEYVKEETGGRVLITPIQIEDLEK